MNMKKWLIGIMALLLIVTIAQITPEDKASEANRLFVNGKQLSGADVSLMNYNAEYKSVYIPLVSTAKALGLKVEKIDSNNVMVFDKANEQYLYRIGSSVILKGSSMNTILPYETKVISSIKVPVQKGPYLSNNHFLVPHKSFTDVLDIAVEATKRSDGGWDVYVGSKPVKTGQATNVTPPKTEAPKPALAGVKQDSRFPYPSNWVAPSIGDTRTSKNIEKDALTLEKKLGYSEVSSSSASFDIDGNYNFGIFLTKKSSQDFEVSITIPSFKYNTKASNENKIPYILKETLTFYGVPELYNVVEAGKIKGDKTKWDKPFKIGNRSVEVWDTGGQTTVMIGKAGVKYDANWKQIK